MLNKVNLQVVDKQFREDAVVLFLCKECPNYLDRKVLPEGALFMLDGYLAKDDEFYKPGKIGVLTYQEGEILKQMLVLGCGEEKECSPGNFRNGAANAIRKLKDLKVERAKVIAPIIVKHDKGHYLEAMAQGFFLGAYTFDKYQQKKDKVENITVAFVTKVGNAAELLVKAEKLETGVCLARDLINEPGNVIYPEVLAECAGKIAEDTGLEIEILDEKMLQEKNMLSILAVGQGSVHKPRIIVLKYNGAGQEPYMAYVGKGITFDSGGISIKPTDGMGEMKDDMSGAADVLAAIRVVTDLKLEVNLMAVLACAENMPGGNAQRPGDIVRAANGKTIEVITTDAEGRMVLADAVWYACRLGAKKVVDIATLTGAAIIALGNDVAAIIANDDGLAQDIVKAGKLVGEPYWQLPSFKEYKDLIKSQVADLKNSGGRAAGTITGGLFIGEFVDKGVQWAHLDIGGTASVTKTVDCKSYGGTAFGVATLVKLAEL